jgi:hypothetical protein
MCCSCPDHPRHFADRARKSDLNAAERPAAHHIGDDASEQLVVRALLYRPQHPGGQSLPDDAVPLVIAGARHRPKVPAATRLFGLFTQGK